MRKVYTADSITIVADCETRAGNEKFTHTCKIGLYDTQTGGVIEATERVVWNNRTWEEHPFQKVLKKAAETLYARAKDTRHLSAINFFYSSL